MNRLVTVSLLLALTALSCKPPADPKAGLQPSDYHAVAMPGPKTVDANAFLFIVRFRLLSVEVPVGSVSASEELWSYLDEEKVSASDHGSLGRNGFRVGLGKQNSWPDVVKILTRLTGRKIEEANGVIVPGRPYPIVLRQNMGEQTLFLTKDDRTLQGADYPAGDNILGLACSLNEDDPSIVQLSVVPQVRTTQRHWEILQENGLYTTELQPTVFSFDALGFRATMPSKDFIVLGPGALSRRPQSLGHQFLTRLKQGMTFETVVVLIPEVVAQKLYEEKSP